MTYDWRGDPPKGREKIDSRGTSAEPSGRNSTEPTGAPVLSLVFPAFNEAENLPRLLESALSIGHGLDLDFEIIIVDDGSQDRSAELLAAAGGRDRRIRVVEHAANQGYGAALRSGLREARGEFVFFSDADLQFDLAEIRHLLEFAGEFQIVAGYRAPRRDPWIRRAIAAVWGGLVRILFDLQIRDIDCAFKLFHRDVLDAIPIESIGAFVNTEILARARAAGFAIKQVPVSHRPRRSGRQTGAHPRVILRAIVELSQLYGELRAPLKQRRLSRRKIGKIELPERLEETSASPSMGPLGLSR
ncbi:MAG: glycosyltransferase family 2 protein [Myxococcota bacterium]